MYSPVKVSTAGILDSGAEATSTSIRTATQLQDVYPFHQDIEDRTTYIYGNNNSLTSTGKQFVGDYRVDVMPDPVTTTLISVPQIVDAGHNVLFKADEVIISDEQQRYKVSYPRGKGLSWRIPLEALEKLSNLKRRSRSNRRRSRSARLHSTPVTARQRVMDLHSRMAHAPEDIMCLAVNSNNPSWINTGVTTDDIRKVFSSEPCLACVLAKRRADGPNVWSRNREKSVEGKSGDLRNKDNDVTVINEPRPMNDGSRVWGIGECITVDNIGPINPESEDGYKNFFLFKDMTSKMVFLYLTESCDEESYLYALEEVVSYFKRHGHQCKVIRSDYFSTFLSEKVSQFEADSNLVHESSGPYLHWQNGVEREVQTFSKFVSANIHDQLLLRADMWSHAAEHWVRLHNDIPNKDTGKSPNQLVLNASPVDARHRYRYAFGDLVTFGVPKKNRSWKFDVRNDVGFFLGDEDGVKGSCRIYRPYEHKVTVRADVHRINISELQLLSWYGKRAMVREQSLPYSVVKNAVIDMLAQEGELEEQEEEKATFGLDGNYWTDPDDIADNDSSSSSEGEEGAQSAQEGDEVEDVEVPIRHSPRLQTRKALIASLLDGITDDLLKPEEYNERLHIAMNQLRLEAQHMVDDDLDEEIDTRDALNAPDRQKFIEAIQKEIKSLIELTKTLVPISQHELSGREFVRIGTTVKCKRKKKGDGTPDKHKARSAARGDVLVRIYKKLNITPPKTFSPTVGALTFSLILQLAVILGMKMATTDITSAYLQVQYPSDHVMLVTKLERNIAELCNLDPDAEYRINKYIYGLPDSGRAFYYLYKSVLEKEGYRCSRIDPCLFIKKDDTETTYVLIHVDDTYIFSDSTDNHLKFVERMNRHLPVTLDTKADSFLGVHIQHNEDGSVELTQEKLVNKLLKEFPDQQLHRQRSIVHPYGTNTPPSKEDTDAVVSSKEYLHTLGMLMYLTRSRPDILTAVSFAATKSHNPSQADYDSLMEIVEYIRQTRNKSYHIYKTTDGNNLQLTCEVDASYLVHPDSKGHTGYTMGFGKATGTFYCKSTKQTAVTTSSTHAEMRAIYTLVKDILYIIQLCNDIGTDLKLPAIILEDNSAVIAMTTEEASYLKKCKHFIMVINYVREQVEAGLISINKVKGSLNNADILTKKIRDRTYPVKVNNIMGHSIHNKGNKSPCAGGAPSLNGKSPCAGGAPSLNGKSPCAGGAPSLNGKSPCVGWV